MVTIGAIGGALGALLAPLLRRLAFSDDFDHDRPPSTLRAPKDRPSYGLGIVTNVVAGLLLPRLALAMDGVDYAPWDAVARMSSHLR